MGTGDQHGSELFVLGDSRRWLRRRWQAEAGEGTLTISETPTAGGDAPAASLFNLNTIYDIQFSGVAAVANGATGVPLRFVRSSGKILGYTSNGAAAASLAEKTDAYSAAHTVEVTVWGT